MYSFEAGKKKYKSKNIAQTVILLLCALLIPVLKTEYSLWIIFFLSLNFFIFVYLKKTIVENNGCSMLIKLCIAAFTIRVLLVIAATLYPVLNIPSDATGYEEEGHRIANVWSNGHLFFNLPASHFLYYMYNAIAYYLFGFYPSIVRIFNSFLGVMTGINVYFITKRLFDSTSAKISTFLTLLFPSLLFLQTMNLKEAFVVFLLIIIIKNLIYLKDNPSMKTFFITLGYSVLLTLTRNYAGIFLTGVASIFFLIISRFPLSRKIIIAGSIIAIMGFVTYKSGMGLFGMNYIKFFLGNFGDFDTIRRNSYHGGSEVLQDFYVRKPSDLIRFIPLAFLYFMFSPFPWQLDGSFLQLLGVIENTLWYVMFFAFMIKGFYWAYKKEKTISVVLVIILISLISLYILQMGNMGFSYRMRGQLMPVFFIFVSLGIVEFNKRFIRKEKHIEAPE